MSDSGHQPCPPINNLLQPDQYHRLDAQAVERTRVANTQLDQRLSVQHKLLAKYRLAAERRHRREKERVRKELTQLTVKLPAVSRIHNFRNKFLYGEGVRKSPRGSLPSDLQTPRKTRGVPEDRCQHPFCERFFIHHLPGKSRYYKTRTPTPPFLPGAGGGEGAEGGGGGGGGGGGDGGGVGEEIVALVPDVIVSEMNVPQFAKPVDSVHQVHDTHPARTPSGADARLLTLQTDPTAKVERASARDTRSPKKTHSNRSARQSGKGRELDRKSPNYAGSTSLPPIQKQNVRLARSSPSLFQG